MFYNVFKLLCDERHITPSRACIDMGLSKSLASKWKTKGESPRADVLPKIAEYFNVSVSYLLGEEQEKPTLSGELSDARKQLDAALDDMSDEELQFLMSKIKAIKEMRE